MLETRVEDLITDYMEHYEVGFDEAKQMMIEDLNSAVEEE